MRQAGGGLGQPGVGGGGGLLLWLIQLRTSSQVRTLWEGMAYGNGSGWGTLPQRGMGEGARIFIGGVVCAGTPARQLGSGQPAGGGGGAGRGVAGGWWWGRGTPAGTLPGSGGRGGGVGVGVRRPKGGTGVRNNVHPQPEPYGGGGGGGSCGGVGNVFKP